MKDYKIKSNFYTELLNEWSSFREKMSSNDSFNAIIWNNKNIRIDNRPLFNQDLYDLGICFPNDLHLNLSNIQSYNAVKGNSIKSINILFWTAIRLIVKKKSISNYSENDIALQRENLKKIART